MTFRGSNGDFTITIDTVFYEENLGKLRKIIAYWGTGAPEHRFIEGIGHRYLVEKIISQ
ncbi:MAG: hypothetical protein ACI94Y_001715 [Maribacter sp.]|jgi:hypothetical protein